MPPKPKAAPKPKAKSKPKPTKKPGGQPGNKNAYRHGIYTPRFAAAEQTMLGQSTEMDVISEISLLRVYINRLASLIELKTVPTEKELAALNALTNMTTAVSTQIRTHYLIRGKGSDVEKTILQALEEIRLEMGI